MLKCSVLQIRFSSEYKMIMKPTSYVAPCTCVSIIQDAVSRESNVGKTAKELENEADKQDGSKLYKN